MPLLRRYRYQPTLERVLAPIAKPLAKIATARNLSVDQLHIIMLVASVLVGFLVALAPTARFAYVLLFLVLLERLIFMFAIPHLKKEGDEETEKTQQPSATAELSTVLADAALFLPFALVSEAPLVIIIVLLALVAEFARVLTSSPHSGPMAQTDRLLIFLVLSFIMMFWQIPAGLLGFVWYVMLVFLVWTILNRVRFTPPPEANS